jgi:transposase
VSPRDTIRRYLRLRRETGSVAPKPPAAAKRTFSIGQSLEQRRALWKHLEEHYDATLEKHCLLWEIKQGGVKVSISTMSRAIRRLGWTLKKRVWVPPNETKKREVLGEMR